MALDMTRDLVFAILCVGLVGSAVGLTKTAYEIRRLKEQIMKLQRPEQGLTIYWPTLDEIIRFQGDAMEYAEGQRDTTIWLRQFLDGNPIDFFESVRFPLQEGCKWPRSVLEGLRTLRTRQRVFSVTMSVILGLLLISYMLFVVPDPDLGPDFFPIPFLPWWVGVFALGPALTYGYMMLLKRILRLDDQE